MIQILKKGSKGSLVTALQYILNVVPDGIFGSKTKTALIAYQEENGLEADGKCGEKTYRKIVDNMPTIKRGYKGPYVYALEVLLNTLKLNGEYTKDEIDHVKAFQAANGLEADGIIGKKTFACLLGLDTEAQVDKKQPVNYKQYDERWAKIMYSSHNDSKQTYKSSGCGPTSMANICATVIDPSITPVTLGELSLAWGNRTYSNGTSWSFFKRIFNHYDKFTKFIQTSSFETMRSCLNSGGYAIVSFGPSRWTSGGHYCTLWKDDGTYIYINDPASASSSRAKGTYAEVKEAAKQYFCFWFN